MKGLSPAVVPARWDCLKCCLGFWAACIIFIASSPRPAAADILVFSGFTVPQTVEFNPDGTCFNSNAFPDNTCGMSATGSASLLAADGTVIAGVSSVYGAGEVEPQLGLAYRFQLNFSGNIGDSQYDGSEYVGLAPGDVIGPDSSVGPAPNPVISYEEDPFSIGALWESPFGTEWVQPGEPIYMGTAFQDDGNTYYGWFEFTYTFGLGGMENLGNPNFVAENTPQIVFGEYAYEACPGASITVGVTQGGAACGGDPPDPPVPEPATFVLLTSGAMLLYVFRKQLHVL